MGDRKGRLTQMQAAQEIISKGWSITNLRDEIYMQLCKQTTENRKGYVLMASGTELSVTCMRGIIFILLQMSVSIIICTIETLVPRCLNLSYFEDYGLIFFQCISGTCKYILWRLMIKLKNQ